VHPRARNPQSRIGDYEGVVRRVLALLPLLIVVSCSSEPAPEAAPTEPPTTVSDPADDGSPGELLDATPVTSSEDLRAWMLTYRGIAEDDRQRAITGMLVTPTGTPPADGWPTVSWGHPTTGTADICAPSWDGPEEIQMVHELIDAGWAVVATDYEGLGSESGHPYLVGPSAGRSMLDAVNAAALVDDADLNTERVALLGFSQGGHGALWAAQIAPEYAPEIGIVGVAVAAPVSDVTQFVERAEAMTEQFGVLVTVAYGYQQAYPELDLADVLTDEALDRLGSLEEECIGDVVITYTDEIDTLLVESPRSLPGWMERLDEGLAGTEPLGVPVLVVQGADDPIVYRYVTDELVDRLCGHGDEVNYRVLPEVDHASLRLEDMLAFLSDRADDHPMESNCPS
jgi:pimeloyl-ACP methyl ester carboxylesterase